MFFFIFGRVQGSHYKPKTIWSNKRRKLLLYNYQQAVIKMCLGTLLLCCLYVVFLLTLKSTFGAWFNKIMPDSNHFTFSNKAVTLKEGTVVYSELWTICLSNFAAIPAVHQCHKLIIDQRLMRLMFTVSRLLPCPHHSYVSIAAS